MTPLVRTARGRALPGKPSPRAGGERRLHPLGEGRRGRRAAGAGAQKTANRAGLPRERRFNGSPIGKRNRNFTLSL